MKTVHKTRILPIVVMLAALGALAGCGGDEAPPADTTAAAPAAPAAAVAPVAADRAASAPAVPQTVAEMLDAARLALREQRYVSPPGNNAIEFYLNVLALEPDNRQAQIAILDLMPQSQGSAEQMIDTNRLDEAQAAVALLKRAQPTSVVVTSLEQRIVTQRRADDQRRTAEEEAAKLAERQAREQASAAAQAAAAPPPAAATPATPARASTPPPVSAPPTAPPPATTATTAPPTQVASTSPAPSVAAQGAPQNKDFQILKKVGANYPPQMIRSRTEGWVELSFTITASGNVEDVSVVDANPRRAFDREAIRALSQWKFSPRIENGKPVAAKARQRLEFTLN